MLERPLGSTSHDGACPTDEVPERLPIEMRRNTQQGPHARLFHVLGAQERMKVPVPAVPATVIVAFQTVRLDLGVDDHSWVIDDATPGAHNAQLELLIFDRTKEV